MSDAQNPRFKVISIKNPWAFLISQGWKRIENRKVKLPQTWIGHPVLIHASKQPAPLKIRKKYHYLIDPYIQSNVILAERYGASFEAFDKEMKDFHGAIVGCVRFDASDLTASDDTSEYPFYDVPEETRYHWKIGAVISFPSPFEGYSGKLGWCYASEKMTKRILQSFFGGTMKGAYSMLDCHMVCIPFSVRFPAIFFCLIIINW